MGMFIDSTAVTISDDTSENYIRIKAQMGIADTSRANDALLNIGADGVSRISLGNHQLELLKINIVGWGGPDFDGVALTPINIERLDPHTPLLKKVLDEIEQRNEERPSPDPKGGEPIATTSPVAIPAVGVAA